MLRSVLFCFVFFFFFKLRNCERKKKKHNSQSLFFPLFQGILLCQIQRKTDLNGKDLNRLTEQKTGEDVNRNKLGTEKKEEEEDMGHRESEAEEETKRPERKDGKKREK